MKMLSTINETLCPDQPMQSIVDSAIEQSAAVS